MNPNEDLVQIYNPKPINEDIKKIKIENLKIDIKINSEKTYDS